MFISISCRSSILTNYRSATAQVCVNTGPRVDVGWINSATVFLFYGQYLIGEMVLEDTFINTEISNDVLVLEMEAFEIQDMTAFKNFVRGIMPKPHNGCPPDKTALIGELEVVEKGHRLTLAIDLCGIGGLTTDEPKVFITNDLIEITISMMNATPVEIYIDNAEFRLEKDGNYLATLSGNFYIELEKRTYRLKGQIQPNEREKLFGNAVLTGYSLKSDASGPGGNEKTWLTHALREFKIDVNLDEIVVCQLE